MIKDMIERVKYNKQPLTEVIYQLRYPTILRINATEPVDFQERIRREFPYYQKLINDNVVEIKGVKQPIGKEFNYEFVSKDRGTKINLTSSFISISSIRYDRWEQFRKTINNVKKVFEDIYHPQFYIRVGLRYKDVIDKQALGLGNMGWTDLIKPNILGTINKENQNSIRQWVMNCEFYDKDTDVQTRQVFHLSKKIGTSNIVMVFDCDYFHMGTIQPEAIIDLSNLLHDKSSSFIRSAITEVLHQAMEPVKLD